MIKVALIRTGDGKYLAREYIGEKDLMFKDNTMVYGEYWDIEDAVIDLFKIHKENEFIIKLFLEGRNNEMA